MRTETDDFRCTQDPSMDMVKAEIDIDDVVVKFYNDDWSCETVFLTKQQAAKFARQILEMCGEGENEL